MNLIHSLLVSTHIFFGVLALILFWLPVVTKKGGPLHRRAGRHYATVMYIVSVSAFLSCLLVLADPIGIRRPGVEVSGDAAATLAQGFRLGSLFLLMLSVLVFVSVRHGLLALREKREAGILRTPLHRGSVIVLGVLGVGVTSLGLTHGDVLLIIFGGISMVVAASMYRETRPERLTASQRIIAHLGAMIGSGIGAHTAFFAFGGSRLLSDVLPGQWQTLSWIVAPIVGAVAITILTRRYRSSGRRNAATAGTTASR